MEWLRIIGFCLLAAVMVMLLRQFQPQMAGLLSVAFGVLVFAQVLPEIHAYIQLLESFLSSLSLDSQYFRVMMKAMGIALITQMTVQACHDMEASSIAKKVELLGRLALLSISVPVFMELTQMALDVLQ